MQITSIVLVCLDTPDNYAGCSVKARHQGTEISATIPGHLVEHIKLLVEHLIVEKAAILLEELKPIVEHGTLQTAIPHQPQVSLISGAFDDDIPF